MDGYRIAITNGILPIDSIRPSDPYIVCPLDLYKHRPRAPCPRILLPHPSLGPLLQALGLFCLKVGVQKPTAYLPGKEQAYVQKTGNNITDGILRSTCWTKCLGRLDELQLNRGQLGYYACGLWNPVRHRLG